jgi:hypothetical protein
MRSKSRSKTAPATEEQWNVVQVAAAIGKSYQTARNQMLQGEFGPSVYDAATRKLTVAATRVRTAVGRTKSKRRST